MVFFGSFHNGNVCFTFDDLQGFLTMFIFGSTLHVLHRKRKNVNTPCSDFCALCDKQQLPASFVKTSIAKLGAASFVKTSNAKHGPAVTLEGPGKGTWEVEIGLGKENHSLEFRNGWQKFVGDHFLQIGDQLSFTLVAGSYFQVMV